MKLLLSTLLITTLFVGCGPSPYAQYKPHKASTSGTKYAKSAVYASMSMPYARSWVKQGRVNEVDKSGFTALAYCMHHPSMEVFNYFIANGAKINSVNKYGQPLILFAIASKTLDKVKRLIELGANIYVKDKSGYNAMYYAIVSANIEMVEFVKTKQIPILTKIQTMKLYTNYFKNMHKAFNDAKKKYPQYATTYDKSLDGFNKMQTYLKNIDSTSKYLEKARSIGTKQAFKDFMQRYPKSSYIDQAKDEISLIEFNKIAKPSKQSYVGFLRKYPNSSKRKFIETYITNLDNIKAQKIFDKIKESKNIDTYLKFIRDYPYSDATVQAKAFVVDIEYKKVVKHNTLRAYTKFSQDFPHSKYADEIVQKLAYFGQKKIIDTIAEFMKEKDIDGMIRYVHSSEKIEKVALAIPKIALLFTGPKELLVIKVLHHKKKGLGDAILSSKIRSIKKPYKNFTLDEITILKKQGLSETLLAAMLDATSAYEDRVQRQKEQKDMIAKQEAIAKGMQVSQAKALKNMQAQNAQIQQANQGPSMGSQIGDALIKKGTEKLAGKLFDSLF